MIIRKNQITPNEMNGISEKPEKPDEDELVVLFKKIRRISDDRINMLNEESKQIPWNREDESRFPEKDHLNDMMGHYWSIKGLCDSGISVLKRISLGEKYV